MMPRKNIPLLKNVMSKKKGAVTALLFLTLLVAAACFLPQLVFFLQDSLRMGRVVSLNREGLDVENLNIPYETSVGRRLESFAAEKGECFVTDSEVAVSMERYEQTEEVLYGEFIMNMSGNGFLPASFFNGYDIEEMKKYVIYKESLEGVAIMAWYARIAPRDSGEIELLWDERTGTVYYVRYQDEAVDAVSLSDEIFYYASDYYGSDFRGLYNDVLEEGSYEWEENGGGDWNVAEDKGYLNYELKAWLDNREVPLISQRRWGGENTTTHSNTVMFPFGEEFLHFFHKVKEEPGRWEISLGLREIGELIPEFSK